MTKASHNEMKIEGKEQQQLEGEPNLDCMDQQVHNLLKFKNFYDQMVCVDQRLAITKPIIKLTDTSDGSELVQ